MTSCLQAREAASARLDAERSDVAAAELSDHLRDCLDCGIWATRATQIQSEIPKVGELGVGLDEAILVRARAAVLSIPTVSSRAALR